MTPRLFVRDAAAADLEEAAEWYEARRSVPEPNGVVVLADLRGRRDTRVWQSRA